jgi:hypothetical protein
MKARILATRQPSGLVFPRTVRCGEPFRAKTCQRASLGHTSAFVSTNEEMWPIFPKWPLDHLP